MLVPIANRTATNHLATTITKFRNKIKDQQLIKEGSQQIKEFTTK